LESRHKTEAQNLMHKWIGTFSAFSGSFSQILQMALLSIIIFLIVGIYSSAISISEDLELHRSSQEVYHKGIRAD
jgi:hypothetical protein